MKLEFSFVCSLGAAYLLNSHITEGNTALACYAVMHYVICKWA